MVVHQVPDRTLTDHIYNESLKNNGMNTQVDASIYSGKFDNRLYPFVEYYVSAAKHTIVSSDALRLRCPVNLNISNNMNSNNFNIRKVESNAFRVPPFSVIRSIRDEKYKNSQAPHVILANVSERINDILYKRPNIHLCWTMYKLVCPKVRDMSYIFVDSPPMSLAKWVKSHKISTQEWKCILFQILFTLEALRKHLPGFVHHNLTPDYIFVEKVASGGQFIYKYRGQTFFIPNNGYLVKLVPSQFTYVPGMYENVLAYDEAYQMRLGLSFSNTSSYDVHLLCNSLVHLKSSSGDMKALCAKLVGDEYLCKTNKYVKDYRLRFGGSHRHLPTAAKVLKSDMFKSFHRKNNKRICLHPIMKL
tara:strand:- start:1598 stop:2680 length:1083 start_codon:yes stop_codon:yes gene_type:complete